MRYTVENYRAVSALLGIGHGDYEIARETGVHRATVRNWRIAATPPESILRSAQRHGL